MSAAPESPKSSRTPWIIAGVLGCLVICLAVAVLAIGGYVLFAQPTPVARVAPTNVPFPTPASTQPTLPPAPQATATLPTPSGGQPTLPPATQSSGGQPTLPPTAPTQPPAPPPTTKPAAPTGKIAFSVTQGSRPEDQYIWIMNTDGSGAKQILQRASGPTFSPDGKQIAYYHWTDGIFVVNADGSGAPGKKIVGDTNVGFIDWSHDGRWIAFSTQPGGQGNISIDAVAPDGTGRRHITVGKSPSWSPDDTTIAMDSCDMANHCGIYKTSSAGGGGMTTVVADGGGLPDWSPDAKRIVYQTSIDGTAQLVVINADGTGKKQLTQGASMHVDAVWSPDGNFIFYRSPESGTWGIWRMNADGSNPVKLIDNVAPVTWPFERLAVTK